MMNTGEPNVFEQLQEEHEEGFNEVSDSVKKNISSRRGFWALVGNVIDLYLPKVVSTLLGGNDITRKDTDRDQIK